MTFQDGKKTIPIGEGVLTRASQAFSPETGQGVRDNVPRVQTDRIPFNTWTPQVYFTFPGTETRMEYDTTTNNLLLRQIAFEAAFPEFTKIVLGTSFQGRQILGYRLGPVTGKHFVVTCAVHGNEIDGVNGAFKAMELLAREARFGPFRSEWTIFFVPAMNPDGWKLGTRNLANLGPNGLTVNLNRNWDWFWDEYVETDFESKGSAPESEAETQALLNYFRTGNGGGPVNFGFFMDIHANQGTGARYQSRDRIFRGITNASYSGAVIPTDRLTWHLDWYIRQTMQVLTRERALNFGGPDLFIRYLRSRFRPHMHAYFSSQGLYSMAIEELKVDSANGFETFASAANYRLDYILTAAALSTSSFWQFEDGVLLEKGGTNLLSNAEWEQWQPEDERPGFWSTRRGAFTRLQNIPGQLEQPEDKRFYNDSGEAVEFQSDIDVTLGTPAENTAAAAADVGEVGFLAGADYFQFILDDSDAAGTLLTLSTHPKTYGAQLANAGARLVDIFGGGDNTGFPVGSGSITNITRIDTLLGTELGVGNLNTARHFHAVADNFTGSPGTPSSRLAFIFGGLDAAASRLASIETWDPNTTTATPIGAVLPQAISHAAAVYFPTTNKVYIIGGRNNSGVVDTIYEYDVSGASISTPAVVLPKPLAGVAAAYVPFRDSIYIFGGEESSGVMSSEVYRFDPQAGTIVQEDVRQNLGDQEGVEAPGDEAGPWIIDIGRWAGVTLLEQTTDSIGAVYLPGGRLNNGAGAVLDTVYRYEPDDDIIGLPRESDFGYVTFGGSGGATRVVDRGLQTDQFDDFSTGLDESTIWDDPDSVWEENSGLIEPLETTGAPGGFLKLQTSPLFRHERVTLDIKESATPTPRFGVVLRGTFTGGTLDDGYHLRYIEVGGAKDWFIDQVVSGTPTVIATKDVAAISAEQIITTVRELIFRVEDDNPVHIILTLNGTTIFDIFDLTEARITQVGQMAIDGESTVTNFPQVDNVRVESAGWREGRFSGSVSVRAAAGNIAGYLRQNIQPTDDSSSGSPLGSPGGDSDDLTTRRVRNYYTIPPAAWWQQYRLRVDMAESALNRKEDGFRYYLRLYKHLQTLRFDGPCVTEGLLGRSFIHPNNPSADEDIRWAGAVNLNALQIQFRWLPNFGCVDVPDIDLELARFEIDASNFLSLKVLAGDPTQREYNQHDIHGPHEPTLRLSKTRLGSEVASVDLVTYWGYDLREPSLERLDDVLLLTIQHNTVGLSLRVDKYGGFGEKRTADDLTAFAGNGLGDIVYNGSGYYGPPVVVDENADREVGGVQRRVKSSRPDLARRLFVQERNMVAAGERDTTNGQRVNDQPFLLEEDFARADDPNLGSNWDIIRQTGNGFNIVSNKASCTDIGFERWDAAPRHRDYTVEADVAVAANADLVGVIGRYPNEFFNSDFASTPTVGGGIGMELVQLTPSTAELRLVAWWLDARGLTYDTTALSAYTAGVEYRMRLTLNGSTITGTIAEIGTGTVLATVNGISTLFMKPGRIVIYGEAPTSPVTISRIIAIPSFVTDLT